MAFGSQVSRDRCFGWGTSRSRVARCRHGSFVALHMWASPSHPCPCHVWTDVGAGEQATGQRVAEDMAALASDTKLQEACKPQNCLATDPAAAEHLFESEHSVRVLDAVSSWLASSEDVFVQGHSDAPPPWEFTLRAIQHRDTSQPLVSKLDPDATLREGRRLHPADEEQEAELLHMLWKVCLCLSAHCRGMPWIHGHSTPLAPPGSCSVLESAKKRSPSARSTSSRGVRLA